MFELLFRECHRLFPDSMFDDLYARVGKHSVPPMILACTTVLQHLLCLSDRKAVDALSFDLRWKYACGGLDVDAGSFDHTVLVGFRARLAASGDPGRVFRVVVEVAGLAGMVGRRRVLDSTPIYDAGTMGTVTSIRSGIRQVLGAAVGDGLGEAVRGVLVVMMTM